jgi:glutamate-ammonia-ligase adenylyltransferase
MELGFSISSDVPPPFDQERARRFAEEFAPLASALLEHPPSGALLRAVAGNSPYLSRLMLKEHKFLREFFDAGPDNALDQLETQAADVAHAGDLALAMQQLRIAKRRAALAIGLGDDRCRRRRRDRYRSNS